MPGRMPRATPLSIFRSDVSFVEDSPYHPCQRTDQFATQSDLSSTSRERVAGFVLLAKWPGSESSLVSSLIPQTRFTSAAGRACACGLHALRCADARGARRTQVTVRPPCVRRNGWPDTSATSLPILAPDD
uniref:Uncharacterized protein n=1 Tax=Leersia perrieri TaxID=77586 RepID=A0A0D9W9M6_9ORYZ